MNTKTVRKLHTKKYRTESGFFLVQGEKNLLELFESDFVIEFLYITEEFSKKYHTEAQSAHFFRGSSAGRINVVDESELLHMGTLDANNGGLAVVHQKKEKVNIFDALSKGEIVLALDAVNDPGNLGTIIRIADWYGISTIVASVGTTDVYGPKTISATMGSFARVSVQYGDLKNILKDAYKKGITILGSDLEGENVHTIKVSGPCIVVMGSESHGIDKSLHPYITKKITIPRFGEAESLNVGVATAIVLDNLKR